MPTHADTRRSWMSAEARAATLRTVTRPSLGDVFKNGFMNGSMLQMAVCSPPRSAETEKVSLPYSAVYLTRLKKGEAVAETLTPKA